MNTNIIISFLIKNIPQKIQSPPTTLSLQLNNKPQTLQKYRRTNSNSYSINGGRCISSPSIIIIIIFSLPNKIKPTLLSTTNFCFQKAKLYSQSLNIHRLLRPIKIAFRFQEQTRELEMES